MAKQKRNQQIAISKNKAQKASYKDEIIPFGNSIKSGAALLALIIMIAYFPALFGGYVWDDLSAIKENTLLRTSDGLRSIWLKPSLNQIESHYWPLVYTVFWVEYHLWGAYPFGYHLINILLHIANTILLWIILKRLSVPGAFFAAAIFALHPTHTGSVAWVIERKDVLSALFYLLAFLAYIHFEDTKKLSLYSTSLILFLCAMLSKSIVVSLPIIFLLWIWWKKESVKISDVLPLVPFFIIAVIISVLDVAFTRQNESLKIYLTFIEKSLIAGRALCFYAWKIFAPINLMLIYPKWKINVTSVWQYIFPLAVIGILLLLWLKRNQWGKGPLTAVIFFCITLGPVLGFITFAYMESSYAADRFQYLASIGLIALAAAAITKIGNQSKGNEQWIKNVGIPLMLIVLGAITWRQAMLYKDTETMFTHNVALNPDAAAAHYNLGRALYEKGEKGEKDAIDKALFHFSEAVRLKPDYVPAHNNLANALLLKDRLDEAIYHYQKAIEFNPQHILSLSNLGYALTEKGDFNKAIYYCNKAIEINPNFASAYNNLGLALAKQGRIKEATAAYLKAVKADPNYLKGYRNLANALMEQKNYDEAIRYYLEVVRLDPGDISIRNELGFAYSQIGKIGEAIAQYKEAMKINPDLLESASNLAWVLATTNDAKFRNGEEAVKLAKMVYERSGGKNYRILAVLAAAYAETGNFDNAINTVQKAAEIAQSKGDISFAQHLQEHLKLYREKRPFRTP